MVVILLAGLTAIPRELEEAATIDGASWRQYTRNVTIPLLSPTIFFLLVISAIKAFQAFKRMQSSGTMNLKNAVGEEGEVYLTIKENEPGKVRVAVQEHLKVFDAVSDDGTEIPTSTAGVSTTALTARNRAGVLAVTTEASARQAISVQPTWKLGNDAT